MKHEGTFGTATLCAMPEQRPTGDQKATICAWLLKLPNWSPAWDEFLLTAVHLRPIDGVKPATITLEGATHELILAACDPARPTDPENVFQTAIFLTPINVVQQFIVDNDEQAIELISIIAKACTGGLLPIEPQGIIGARDHWKNVVIKTAEHIRSGKHGMDKGQTD